jgi:hypothetical protein
LEFGKYHRYVKLSLVKTQFSRVCLGVAVVLFLGGCTMLCPYPGFYAAVAAFAFAATWASAGRVRVWAILTLVVSLFATAGTDLLISIQDARRQAVRKIQLQKIEDARIQGSNSIGPVNDQPR